MSDKIFNAYNKVLVLYCQENNINGSVLNFGSTYRNPQRNRAVGGSRNSFKVMKWLFISLLLQFSGGCIKNQFNLEFYSLEKSRFNTSFGKLNDSFNFYKFQKYYQSARVDSVFLNHYHYNFEDSAIYNFLKIKYNERGNDFSAKLLSQIGRINIDCLSDTSIIVIDLNDSISLINLSPEFSINALGTCCSQYQNLIVRK